MTLEVVINPFLKLSNTGYFACMLGMLKVTISSPAILIRFILEKVSPDLIEYAILFSTPKKLFADMDFNVIFLLVSMLFTNTYLFKLPPYDTFNKDAKPVCKIPRNSITL